MGKTSLAIAVLQHPLVIERFADRRFFVSCDNTVSSSLTHVLAQALGITPSSTSEVGLRSQIVAWLGDRSCLLVLDNFEDVWESETCKQTTEATLPEGHGS